MIGDDREKKIGEKKIYITVYINNNLNLFVCNKLN